MTQKTKKVVVKTTPKKKTSPKKRISVKKDMTLADTGASLGNALGGPMGALIGRAGGSLLGKITGYGDYQINSNSIMQGATTPSFYNNGDGTIVSHREFIQDITSSQGFASTTFPINPGLPQTFPWLSNIAQDFESYEMLGLVFEYRPASGYAFSGTNAAAGVVMMTTNYDPYDPPFNSKVGMESYEYSTSTLPAIAAMHPVECKPGTRVSNILYVRNGGINTQKGSQGAFALGLYDVGNFQISTQGMQGNNNLVGELWVTYHVRFLKPRMPLFYEWAHANEAPGTSADATHTFGTTTAVTNSAGYTSLNNCPGFSISGLNSFCLNTPGYYFISLVVFNNVTIVATLTPGANISAFAGFKDNALGFVAAVSSNYAMYNAIYLVSGTSTTNQGAANNVVITGNTNLSAGTTDIYAFYMGPTAPPVNLYVGN